MGQELVGNDIKLLSTKELNMIASSVFQARGGFSFYITHLSISFTLFQEINIIQKFIKSNGPKAFIVRTVWRNDRSPYSWIITNKHDFYTSAKIPEPQKYCTDPKIMNSCQIVQTCRGKQVDETVPYLSNIVRYLYIHLGVKFQELIGDFIKDEAGVWWLINIKGFVLISDPLINPKPITNYGDEELLSNGSKFKQVWILLLIFWY